MADIKRYYPLEKNLLNYPIRYKKNIFNEYDKIIKDKNYVEEYDKIISGINPNTNRKIKINGKTYFKLLEKFKINNKNINIIFRELDNIDYNDYYNETLEIYKKIDIENEKIKLFNDAVKKIIHNIKLLSNWDDYIEFNNQKYGIVDKVINYIHVEYNCNGTMIFTEIKTEYIFNDRPFCNYADKEMIYKNYRCNKCNYDYKETVSSSGGETQYIPKTGFWWK